MQPTMESRPLPPSASLIETVTGEYPGAEINVSFPDRWQFVHRFKRVDKSLYVAGFPPSQERPRGDHFYGLPRELNRSLTTYRLYKLFKPQPIPLFHVAWNSWRGEGRIIGRCGLRVHLQPLGQAQIWRGDTDSVLWECYLFESGRQRQGWPETLSTFWQAVERDIGVNRIFTQPHEPTFETGYSDFLSRLGYTPHLDFERWWFKEQSVTAA